MERSTSATAVLFTLTKLREAQALTCYCIGQYCSQPPSNPSSHNEGNSVNDWQEYPNLSHNDSLSQLSSCEAKKGAKCFSAVAQVEDVKTGELVPERTFGCLPPDEAGLMQCKANLVPHLNPKKIACCSDEDFCNQKLTPMYDLVQPNTNSEDSTLWLLGSDATTIALLVTFAICFVMLIFIVTCVYTRLKKQEDRRRQQYHLASNGETGELGVNDSTGRGKATISQLIEQSSGSGSGLPLLVQRTIAKQIQFKEIVGRGRYGEVWKARWRGEDVAVKVFFTTDEASWFRETEIYQTVLMRHENILGFIAADIRGTGGTTSMLLITDYHTTGSLYDFLKYNELSEEEMIKLAHSAASGLSHLHLEIHGARGKPAIVHRDIKSRNILVKQNLTCAIADFGLAVKYDSSSQQNKFDFGHHNARVGTIRYMAPEVLSQEINCQDFEALTRADMYSFALVLWELCSRTRVQTISKKALHSPEKKLAPYIEEMPYNLPYSEYVDADPTFEDMKSVVTVKKIRPSASHSGRISSKVIIDVSTLMKECWSPNPTARPPMLRAKKTLHSLKDTHDNKTSSINNRQLNNQNIIQNEIYSYDKKESLSADSDNYSQNSSLTNSSPSQENGVRFS